MRGKWIKKKEYNIFRKNDKLAVTAAKNATFESLYIVL